MPPVLCSYTTKELTRETWPDFEKLFSQKNGWDFCWCMHFHRPCSLPKNQQLRSRGERGGRNHRQKHELLEQGRTHGILVYADGEPVGWCQFGNREELPRIDGNRAYRGVALEEIKQRLWRITCFVVHKQYRRRGIASLALAAALKAIAKNGGGVVEGYPLATWESSTFGNVSTHGTASMFEKAGFKVIGPLNGNSVLMRRTVRPRTPRVKHANR
jgi:ribosomal protein S18 acetylase RimI-like enzyme